MSTSTSTSTAYAPPPTDVRSASPTGVASAALHHGSRPAAPRPGGVRLTRRGRLAVFLASLLVALVALVAIAGTVIAASEPGEPVPASTVEVMSGDTLWDIAAAANPGGDINETVYEIAELNALSQTGDLPVGEQIAVPLY